MASIFNALHIGYSGLNASQVGISTTGHNISNAETDGYTRQRVVTASTVPLDTPSGFIGNGTQIQDIKRIFDNFVFSRYSSTYGDKEAIDQEKQSLEQLSSYFPEIDQVGVKSDLQEFYNMWQNFADNPNNDSIKLALAKQAEILAKHVQYTQDQAKNLQYQLNEQIQVHIDEVNSMAKELAEINKAIGVAEAGGAFSANDLRDKRNNIERDLARLIGAKAITGQLVSNIDIHSFANTKSGSYTVSVNGHNLVDGGHYHPILITNKDNKNGFYDITIERQDGVKFPMEEVINSGKIGALLTLRGGTIDTTSGTPKGGIIQNAIAELDAFASTLIESVNNLYAAASTDRMDSNHLTANGNDALLTSTLNVKTGSFKMVVYDIDGNVAASRDITINEQTTFDGAAGSNSIVGQILTANDDNSDGNATNDIDDFINAQYSTLTSGDKQLSFWLSSADLAKGYTFAIEDNLSTTEYGSGTNFAGALGMHRFFDGNKADNMSLNVDLNNNPTRLSAGFTNVAGDNRIALSMIQHQYESFDHKVANTVYTTSSYGMYDIIATEVGTATNSAIMRSETITTQFNAVELEYFSTSKVSIDEEMTNLIKYQTAYGAAAKVITTIDQMTQTLLGIKQ